MRSDEGNEGSFLSVGMWRKKCLPLLLCIFILYFEDGLLQELKLLVSAMPTYNGYLHGLSWAVGTLRNNFNDRCCFRNARCTLNRSEQILSAAAAVNDVDYEMAPAGHGEAKGRWSLDRNGRKYSTVHLSTKASHKSNT